MLFALLACLSFLLLVALAEGSRRPDVEMVASTAAPLVPAAALSDREDWLQNGQLHQVDDDGQPIGWQLFDITGVGAEVGRRPGESFLRLDCGGQTCIAGLWQRLDGLEAGGYYLEADVYLDADPAASGTVAARLGYDTDGGVDPTAPGVIWSTPARGKGWQRVSLEIEETGGCGTVFVVFDALSAGADCRLAGARLLGPPGTSPPTPSPSAVVTEAEPTVTDVEVRALYVPLSEMDLEDDSALTEVLDRATAARFNTVFLQVRRLGLAYYDSGVEPPAEALRGEQGLRWDPLARAVDLAQERGLRLYAWVEVLPVSEASVPVQQLPPGHLYSLFTTRFGDEWLQPTGEDGLVYASPAHPQVRAYLAGLCRDLVTRYQVQGLHLTGLVYGPAPSAPLGTAGNEASSPLTLLLEEIGREVRAARPEIELSAEVWPAGMAGSTGAPTEVPGGLEGADTGLRPDVAEWSRRGLVDILLPAIYLQEGMGDPESVATLVEDWCSAVAPMPVVPALDGGLRPFSTLEQSIAGARRAGASGVALYDAARLTANGYWLRLASGPFMRPAETPPLFR